MYKNLTIEGLLEKLETRYPNELPQKEISLRDLDFKRGQQDIIKYLYGIIEQQDFQQKKNKQKEG